MSTNARRRSTGSVLLEFLGSMNLAITLLVIIAISSAIGTVLKQNEPYENYIIKFGSFWFEIYKALGLYDIYSAVWFLLILGFLVLSTSICVYRNGPNMLREMRTFRENVAENSLRKLPDAVQWNIAHPMADVSSSVSQHLSSYGYRLRPKDHNGHLVIAGMKGAANRLGYLATHIGIVVICVGAFLDGNMPLKIAEATGKIKVETRNMPTAQVPAISRLPISNRSFRGLVDIPEGSAIRYVTLRIRDGYLLQELPFGIEVKDFRLEQYDNGMAKSYESDLVIYDKTLTQPLHETISVNHPLTYKGYSIYQANFSDGGSKLKLHIWPLGKTSIPAFDVSAASGNNIKIDSPQGPLTVELEEFHLFNVKPAPPGAGKPFRDLGPTFTFKVRDVAGVAHEYENYMQPVEQNGRLFFITGTRDNPNDEFSYVQIPADSKGTINRFMQFMALTRNQQKMGEAALQIARESLDQNPPPAEIRPRIERALLGVMGKMLVQFNQGGFDSVARYLQSNLPEKGRAEAANAYAGLLQKALAVAYGDVLAQEGVKVSTGAAQLEIKQFFDDAVNALGVLPQYGSPYYLQLTHFDQIQASGLQITRAPGKNVVYLGFGLLVVGVFLMFYLPQRRLWAWIKQEDDGQTRVIFAGTSNRDPIGFGQEFRVLRNSLEQRLKVV